MFGVTGTAPATKSLPVQKYPPAKAISNILTADWFWALCIIIGAVLVPPPTPDATTVLGLPKLCIFRNITGIACPGCGMTRSLIATGHFHFEDALAFHPLGPLVLLFLIAYVSLDIGRFFKRNRNETKSRHLPGIIPISVSVAFAIVWLARLFGWLTTPS